MQIELRFIEKKEIVFGYMKEISKKVLRVNYFVLYYWMTFFIVDFFCLQVFLEFLNYTLLYTHTPT